MLASLVNLSLLNQHLPLGLIKYFIKFLLCAYVVNVVSLWYLLDHGAVMQQKVVGCFTKAVFQ